MGYMNKNHITNAANHLLEILKMESSVNFGRFYDGTEETKNAFRKAVGCEETVAMDCAIIQLMDKRIVKTEKAKDNTDEDACGFEGHEIALTEFGKRQLAAGAKLEFVDMDL